jgi:isopenicillin-N epimerase
VPGAVAVNVTAIGAEWYAANLHKWAWTPRSCGFLHARTDARSALHAPILSWGYGMGLTQELDWQGTFDPTPMLCVPEAIACMRELGVDDVLAHNHALAWRAAQALRDRIGATPCGPESMVGSMVTVVLPERFGTTSQQASALRDRLWFSDRIEVQVHEHRGRVQMRVCAQVYCDDDDIDVLVNALARAA